MSDLGNFFNKLKKKYSQDLHSTLMCKVESYDPTLLKATLKPLSSIYGLSLPILVNVPMSYTGNENFIIHVPLKPGDIVVVDICDQDIDNILLGNEDTNVQTERTHELDDSVIIGKISPFTEEQSQLNEDDLFIGKKDGSIYITLKNNGDIIIEGSNVKIGENATESIPLGDSLKTWLDNHVHTGGTGTPTTSSPNPSSKGKVE